MDCLTKIYHYAKVSFQCNDNGSLKRELGIKTPYEAVEKWYEFKPESFSENPLLLNKILYFVVRNLNQSKDVLPNNLVKLDR